VILASRIIVHRQPLLPDRHEQLLPGFACLSIRAASSSVWRYSANADVSVVEAELADGLGYPFFVRSPDEISQPEECVKDVKAEASDKPHGSVRRHEFGS
jgi:hypothetical protein